MTTFSQKNNQCTISVIIVDHNSDHDQLALCIQSLEHHFVGVPFEVILVHNGTKKSFESTRCLHLWTENRGFGHANNLGARAATGTFLLLLNPDTEWISGNIADALSQLQSFTKPGIAGFRLIESAGSIQPWSAGKTISPFETILHNIGVVRSKHVWLSPTTRATDWVSGAAMLIHKECFFSLGGFDETFFLYFEDVDLSLRAKKAQFPIVHMPIINIRHLGGTSMQPDTQKKHYYASQDYYFKKHFGSLQARVMKTLRSLFH